MVPSAMHSATIDSCPVGCTRGEVALHSLSRLASRRCLLARVHGASLGALRSWSRQPAPPSPHHHRGPITPRTLLGSGGPSSGQGRDGVTPSSSIAAPTSTVVSGTTSQSRYESQQEASTAASWPALQPPFTYYASAEEAQSNSVPSGLSPIWKVLLLSDGSVTRHLQLLSGSPVSVECLSMRNVGGSLEGLPPGTELIPAPRVQRQVLLRCQSSTAAGKLDPEGPSSSSSSSNNSCNNGNEASDAGYGLERRTSETVAGANSSTSSGSSTSTSRGRGASGPGGPGPPTLPLVYASSWWNADTIDQYLRDKSKPIWVSLSQGHVELYREVHALFSGDSPQLEELLSCSGPFWGRQYVFWSGGKPLTLIYEVFSPRLEGYLGPADAEGPEGRR